jgi:acyl carrier protein
VDIAAELERFILSDLSGPDRQNLGRRDDLMSLGIVDSLGILRLVAFVEERFAIAVTPDEIVPENFRDIDSLAGFIARKTRRG